MAVTTAPAPTVRSVLAAPHAGRLFATSILARVPVAALGVVVILRARELTGSYAAGGAAAAAGALATGLSQPLLARLVDRLGQARVLLPGAIVAAAALTAFALLPAGVPLGIILATTLIAGTTTPPLGPATRTLIPRVTPDAARLRAAYALESSALEITYIVGPLVFAGAIASWSTAAATLACAALLLGGTAAFLATPPSREWRPAPAPPAGHGWLGALRSPGVRTLLVLLALVGATFGTVEVGVPAAADHAGHPDAAGPLLSLWGAGSMLGGLLAMRLRRPSGPVARLTVAVTALAAGHLLLAPAAEEPLLLGACLLLAGFSIAPSFAAAFGLVEPLAPPGAVTEAFAWLSTGIGAGLAAGGALGGWAVEAQGADAALALAGLSGLVAVAVITARRGTLGG
jgi:predicted MFS family arabinose efflux permease